MEDDGFRGRPGRDESAVRVGQHPPHHGGVDGGPVQALAPHQMCGAPLEITVSRTDVHRPWQVQVDDPTNRHLLYRYPAWPDRMELWPVKNLGCGCRMCTGFYERRAERRRDRHQARRALRRGDV